MSRNYNGMYSAIPIMVFILDKDRDKWANLSDIRSLGSHESHGSDFISNGSTSGGDISSVVAMSENEYDLDDSFIIDMGDTDGEGSYRGGEDTNDSFSSEDYVNIDDEGSEENHGYIPDNDEEIEEEN